MTKDEALRLALEALEDACGNRCNAEYNPCFQREAITTIKAALEAKDEPVVWNEGVPAMLPKQKEGETFIVSYEPKLEAKDESVAWKWHQAPVKTSWGDGMVVADLAIDKDHTASIYCERDQTTKVEAMFTPPQQEVKDEPVAWMRTSGTGSPVVTEELLAEMPEMRWNFQQPLYTYPPQRTWVGLTDEEVADIERNSITRRQAIRAIEAKLKEKNRA